jgi:hypothetical protein
VCPTLPPHAPNLTPAAVYWQMLGSSFPTKGATPLGKTQALMADMGATANNFFIHTPVGP